MTGRFHECLPLILKHEGGYVNHPRDPGGATNLGITQATYDAWRARSGQARRSVQHITEHDAAPIYRAQYWDAVKADEMPRGLDYALFDFAVNSGPARAVRFLQKIVGVEQDGIVGAKTLSAIHTRQAGGLIERLCDARLAWLQRLKTWGTFGRGWTRRVEEVRGAATAMECQAAFQEPTGSVQGRGEGEEAFTTTLKDMSRDPKVWGGAAGVLGSVGGILQGTGPIQYALAAVIVMTAAVVAYKLVRKS